MNSVAFALIRLSIHHSLCVWIYDSLCVCVHLVFVPAVRRAQCFLWPELITCTTTIPDNQWKKDSCNPVNSPGSCSFSRLSSQCLIYFQYLYPRQMLRLFKPQLATHRQQALLIPQWPVFISWHLSLESFLRSITTIILYQIMFYISKCLFLYVNSFNTHLIYKVQLNIF